jgi:hypothetical protein
MNTVENPCVATIALSNPNRPESLGLAMAASAIVKLDNESRGPLNVSGVPNLRKSQVGISGMMNPAPSPIKAVYPGELEEDGKILASDQLSWVGSFLVALEDAKQPNWCDG